MTGTDESEHVEIVDEDHHEKQPSSDPVAGPNDDGSGDPEKKREKVPNFYRQMRAKLIRVLEKTDDEYVFLVVSSFSAPTCEIV